MEILPIHPFSPASSIMIEKPMVSLALSLPTVLLCEILSVWLYVPSLVKLDSAYCHHENRSSFFALYKQPELVCSDAYCPRKNIQWLIKRQIRLRDFVLGAEISAEVAKCYLMSFGQYIQSITISHGATAALIKVAAEYGRNISTLEADEVIGGVPIEMLHLFGSINTLTISITSGSGNLTNNLQTLPNVRKLKICWNDVESEHLVALVDTCPNLTHFFPHGSQPISAASAIRMLSKLSNLIALSLCVIDVDDAALTMIVKCCALIEHLDLHNSTKITDAGIYTVATALKLRSIAVPCDAKLTDKSLEHLSHCANTLIMLLIAQSVGYRTTTNTLSLPAIHTLLSKARRCQYTWRTYILKHDRSLDICSNATAIVVATKLTDMLLLEVAQHCKLLETLNLYCETQHNDGQYTSAGLYAVIEGCPALKTVCVDPKFDKVCFADVLTEHAECFTSTAVQSDYNVMDMDMKKVM